VANAKLPASAPVRADTVIGMDYAYRYPESLRPGTHDIAFVNAGAHRHEVMLSLLKQGVTVQKLLEHVKSGDNPNALLDDSFGALHSPAGTKPAGLLHVMLLPGREYLLVCAFRDAENAPPHFALGMVGSIRVPGSRGGK
jgi:hypothetical protein